MRRRVSDHRHDETRTRATTVAADERRLPLLLAILALAGLVACTLLVLLAGPVSAAPVAPAGFTDELVADVPQPTALAFTPDARMLVATQPGKLRVYANGSLLAEPALDLAGSVCTNSERGMLGVAVDPEFVSNDYVYVYYTTSETGGCKNRVARYVLSYSNVATFDRVLIDAIPSPGGNHNGGDLHFGKDGYLYVSVGDGGTDYAGGGSAGANDAARDPHVLLGKILRVTRDGTIPETNPYRGAGSARCNVTGRTDAGKKCQETFASGLRNPFRIAFDPTAPGTRFFVNDVGQNAWEEIDEGRAGADYGWNVREGFCANGTTTNCRTVPGATVAGMTDPVHSYGRSLGASITGGAFVPNGVWPAAGYDGAYLFADYVSGKIFKLLPSGSGYARTEFVTGMGSSSATSLTFGPHGGTQSLYYTSYANGGDVRRISYTAATANRTPTAAVAAAPSSSDPLTVDFDGSGSTDPDGDALTYLWDFGDGSTATTTAPTTTHAYAAAGSYTATLKVRDAGGLNSAPAQTTVNPGDAAPAPTITAPAAGLLFQVGQEITLSGGATDDEDGPVPDASLSWEVIRHHNDSHTHPYFSGTGNNLTFAAPPPEDLAATGAGNYLEIRLTATDSGGNSRIVSQKIQPRRVNVAFKSSPRNRPHVEVNGGKVDTPKTLVSWEGYELNVNAPARQVVGERTYAFASWSDGGPAAHAIKTPAASATYTATFQRRR